MTFDTTHLAVDKAERRNMIHRDYLAHCHRWTFVVRFLSLSDKDLGPGRRLYNTNLLDIGAGVDLPLYKALCSNKISIPLYTAVDVNALKLPNEFKNRKVVPNLLGKRDMLSVTTEEIGTINVATCFEVLEHVPAAYAKQMVEHTYKLLDYNGYFIVSTPCYDEAVGAAKNHVNEMTRNATGYMFEEAGFDIIENYGTFASERDYKSHMTPEQYSVLEKLRNYYDPQYLATIFAPLFPAQSRNNIWVLKKRDTLIRQFTLPDGPWASGADWKDLIERKESETML